MPSATATRSFTIAESLIGPLLLVGRDGVLTGLYLGSHEKCPVPDPAWVEDPVPFAAVIAQLDEYFAGTRTAFDVEVDLEGTPFQREVWRALQDIPHGETTSYGELARRIGRPAAVRAVGAANGRNPVSIIVPCHRVIGSDGKLVGYGWGVDRKVWLLDHERPHDLRDPGVDRLNRACEAERMGLTDKLETIGAIARTGILNPVRPDKAVRMAKEASKWGQTAAAAVALSSVRHADRTAIIDEEGTLTWAELERRTNAIAAGLRRDGVVEGTVIGILCRNNRGFVEALVAAAKLGADAVLLNTGFAAPQLAEVSRREGVTVLVHDASFTPLVEQSGLGGGDDVSAVVVWPEEMIVGAATAASLPAAGREGHVIILSSGTTGTPKGAKRDLGKGDGKSKASAMTSSLGMLRRLPLKGGDVTSIPAPLFHTWGLSHLLLCAVFGSPMVLRERFVPEDVLAGIQQHRVGTLVAVPAMLQRILALPAEARRRSDTSSLRVVALSGSALPGGLATQWMDAFGDNLFSMYGSTEVAAVALAGPADLRAAPDTAGPIVPGVAVRLLDPQGREVARGTSGRIFVRSALLFEGYTGGGNKEVIDGFMSTGDLGHFDATDRLFVDGREDDMIVSGGENVFPQEVEEVILRLPSVADAAVVGVTDAEFGQRLRAVVVPIEGASPTEEEIRDHVRANLARYKVPRDVVFREELPRNTTGKVLRRVLVDEAGDA